MAKVIVYTTNYCPYCRAAENLLREKGVAFEAIDVTKDDEKRLWLVKTTGYKTVPQIFIDEKPIGGFDNLKKLEESGELDKLLHSVTK
ncbi:MAG: glutaredoxin 3 [Deltaproteobacteria bacterium]|nr:glutaredoxin 3 [Deltaproteobacteria bacterium]